MPQRAKMIVDIATGEVEDREPNARGTMPKLIILKTHPEHLYGVVKEQKHALDGKMRGAEEGDLLLIAEIRNPGSAWVRYGMWFVKQRPAKPGESEAIWNGDSWKYIVEAKGCLELDKSFRPEDEKTSRKSYGQGGTVVYVRDDDADAWRRKGLLQPLLPPLGSN